MFLPSTPDDAVRKLDLGGSGAFPPEISQAACLCVCVCAEAWQRVGGRSLHERSGCAARRRSSAEMLLPTVLIIFRVETCEDWNTPTVGAERITRNPRTVMLKSYDTSMLIHTRDIGLRVFDGIAKSETRAKRTHSSPHSNLGQVSRAKRYVLCSALEEEQKKPT